MGEKFFQPPMIRYSTAPGHAVDPTSRWPPNLYVELILPLSTPHAIRSWAAFSCACGGVLLVKSPIRQIPETNTYICNLYYNRRAVIDLYAPTSCQSATFVRPRFAFCPLFFTKKIINNAVFRHRRYIYASRLMGLRNR